MHPRLKAAGHVKSRLHASRGRVDSPRLNEPARAALSSRTPADACAAKSTISRLDPTMAFVDTIAPGYVSPRSRSCSETEAFHCPFDVAAMAADAGHHI